VERDREGDGESEADVHVVTDTVFAEDPVLEAVRVTVDDEVRETDEQGE
jgi:hypothetical protein